MSVASRFIDDQPVGVSPTEALYEFEESPLLARQSRQESNARSYPRRIPLALKRAKGLYIEDVEGRRFVGSALDWLTPFNLFCGIGLVVAYTLLGTTWLIMKSEGALQNRMRELTRHVLLALVVVVLLTFTLAKHLGMDLSL